MKLRIDGFDVRDHVEKHGDEKLLVQYDKLIKDLITKLSKMKATKV